MRTTNPNGPLEDLAFQLLKIREENYIIRSDIQKVLSFVDAPVKPIVEVQQIYIPTADSLLDIYLNASETKRLLMISHPTLLGFIEHGMLRKHPNDLTPTNCFLLSDVLWIRNQNIKGVKGGRWNEILRKRKNELGY